MTEPTGVRLHVLDALTADGVPAKVLAAKLDLGYSTVTQHLRALAEDGMAVSTKDGSRTLWSVAQSRPDADIEAATDPVPTPTPIDDFDGMAVRELKAAAKAAGIRGYTRMDRTKLLALLREQKAASAGGPVSGAPASADMPADTGALADGVAAGTVDLADAMAASDPTLDDLAAASRARREAPVVYAPTGIVNEPGVRAYAPSDKTVAAPIEGDPGAVSVGPFAALPAVTGRDVLGDAVLVEHGGRRFVTNATTVQDGMLPRPAESVSEPLKPWERAVTPADRLPYVYDALSVPRDGAVDALTRRKPHPAQVEKRAGRAARKAAPAKATRRATPKKAAPRKAVKAAPEKGPRWGKGALAAQILITLKQDTAREWTAAQWARHWNQDRAAHTPAAQAPSVVDAFDKLVRDGYAMVTKESGPRTWQAGAGLTH